MTTRSFARQGVEQIPTQHEGPTVRAMEAKGIRTDKGNLNRFIRKTNALLREAKEKIAALIGWLKDVKAELAKPQPPMLNDLLALHCANRNKGAYSNKAKMPICSVTRGVQLLQSKNLYTVDDLENTLHAMQDKIDTLKKSASSKQARIKEVDELLRMVDYYKSGKPAADKLKSIRFDEIQAEIQKRKHDNELRTFYLAERKLNRISKMASCPLPHGAKKREQLEQEYRDIQTELGAAPCRREKALGNPLQHLRSAA